MVVGVTKPTQRSCRIDIDTAASLLVVVRAVREEQLGLAALEAVEERLKLAIDGALER